MRGVLEMIGIMTAIFIAASALLVILFIPMAYLDSKGCERKAQVQGVETVYHWTTGCVYVNPDYVVTK